MSKISLCNLTEVFGPVEPACLNCGDRGVGLLGIHEWVEYMPDPNGSEQPYPVHHEQEEYGSPCPTCGKEAEEVDRS